MAFFFWQVLQAAWAQGVEVACENALPCYKRSGYEQILAQAKPKGYTKHSLVAFTYLRLTRELMEEENLREFMRFVHQLHGKLQHSAPQASTHLIHYNTNNDITCVSHPIVSFIVLSKNFLTNDSFHALSIKCLKLG